MSDTLAFLHQKGGTGKSTLAITAAQVLARRGQAVLILDVDYQGTATAWGEHFAEGFNTRVVGGIEVRSLVGHEIGDSLARFGHAFDTIIVDAPPTLSGLSDNVLHAVDRVLVPTRPAWPDVWALATVAGLISAGAVTARVEVVFNQAGEDRDMAPYEQYIAALGLTWRPIAMPRHADFAAVFVTGEAGQVALELTGRMLDAP
ncbi:MAG: ParA family protein [Gammaproteobacteria bacterium]|nr:ParA family protein [Gammaproteobacteria bacterium]